MKGHVIGIAFPLLHLFAQGEVCVAGGLPRVKRGSVSGLLFGIAGYGIQHAQLEGGVGQNTVGVLRVDVHHTGGQFARYAERNRRVVDEGAGLARRGDLPAHDALFPVVQVVGIKEGAVFGPHAHQEFHHAFALVVVQGFEVGALAEGQAECS